MGYKRLAWQNEGNDLASKLLNVGKPPDSASNPKRTGHDLPPVVQTYFRRVLSLTKDSAPSQFHPRIHSLELNQKGTFRIKPGVPWRAFSARQTMAGFPHAGFLWDAKMPLIANGYPGAVHVRDAWVAGQAKLQASIAGIVTVASEPSELSHQEPLLVGEMMRWLAEAFLVPTSLLPEAGLVEWSAYKDEFNKVRLAMSNPYHESSLIGSDRPIAIDVNVTFQDDETVVVEAMRPQADTTGFVTRPWIGVLSKFVSIGNDTMMPAVKIPSHMKAGWKQENDEIFYYFDAENGNVRIRWAFDSVELKLHVMQDE